MREADYISTAFGMRGI